MKSKKDQNFGCSATSRGAQSDLILWPEGFKLRVLDIYAVLRWFFCNTAEFKVRKRFWMYALLKKHWEFITRILGFALEMIKIRWNCCRSLGVYFSVSYGVQNQKSFELCVTIHSSLWNGVSRKVAIHSSYRLFTEQSGFSRVKFLKTKLDHVHTIVSNMKRWASHISLQLCNAKNRKSSLNDTENPF